MIIRHYIMINKNDEMPSRRLKSRKEEEKEERGENCIARLQQCLLINMIESAKQPHKPREINLLLG